MMDQKEGFSDIKKRVETILGDILRAQVGINEADPRLVSIYNEMNGSAGNDAVLLEKIKKHYNYRSVVCGQRSPHD